MKTIIAASSRALPSALCTLVLGIIGLWAMPRNAAAEPILYTVRGGDVISTYNATTGAIINSDFISGNAVVAMTFSGDIKNLGYTIFVLQLGEQPANNPTVSQYTTAGAVINLNFVTGIEHDTGIAVVGNKLFVAYTNTGGPNNLATMAEYNATTGRAITTDFFSDRLGQKSNSGPLAASGDNLFFLYENGDGVATVGEYNVKTGTVNASFISVPPGTFGASEVTVSDNHLYLATFTDTTNGTIIEYDAVTGAAINLALITGLPYAPTGLAVSGKHLLVAEAAEVSEYNATTGKLINANFIDFGGNGVGANQLVVRGN